MGGSVIEVEEYRPEAEVHEHVDCPPHDRRWLESHLEQAATMRPHAFCVECGKVKNMVGGRAKKIGFYLSGLSTLKEYLERGKRVKLTQSQSHLIAKSLMELKEFEDRYGMSLDVQLRLYVEAVRRVRPDLDDELILRLLPKVRKRPKKPLIEMMGRGSAS